MFSGARFSVSLAVEVEIFGSARMTVAKAPLGERAGVRATSELLVRPPRPEEEENGAKTDLKRKTSSSCACAMLFALCYSATAQQPKKVPRIGYLSLADPARESARSEAIRLALRELGYIEGQNIAIEYRYAEGKRDRFPELAAELVRLKVDIIVVSGGPADPGGQECDQDDSHRYGGPWARSCRGRPS